jgi:superfamily II DNA or RNA helicase
MNAHAQQARSDVRKDAWLHVPLWMVRDVHAVKKALTIPNGAYFARQYHASAAALNDTPSHFHCYEEDEDGYLRIPRNALGDLKPQWFTEPLEYIARASLPERVPYTGTPWLRHNITLRPRQDVASEALLKQPGDKLLALGCGVGKTVIALHALMEQRDKRLPALVVVHTRDLMEQWIARVRQFWCMGLAMPGIVQGNTSTWEKAPVTIAMLQTLASKQMPAEFYDYFSTIVYDECFIAGTLVDGRPIETVKVGDMVTAFNERTGTFALQPVTHIFRSQAQTLRTVYLDNGASITCTDDHPIWTCTGWALASLLTPGDQVGVLHEAVTSEAVRNMRQDVSTQPGKPQGIPNVRTDQREKGRGITQSLQNRYSVAVSENSDRGGWPKPLRHNEADGGSTQRRVLAWAKVARVEIHQRTSTGGFAGVSSTGTVYNLEVGHYSTYTANGVVAHNCHRLGAPVFLKTAPMFIGERWGLSATSTRPDGNERAFMLHCGQIAHQDLRQDLTPKAFFVRTPMFYDMSRFKMWGTGGNTTNFAKLATHLSQDAERNKLVLKYINRMVRAKRVVLVLGERVDQLRMLAAQVPEAEPLVGPMRVKERRAALKRQVVFATSKLAKEGLDRPEFDCLVVLNPTTDNNWLQQAIGRVQRAVPDKPNPVVVFFEDSGIPPMASRCHRIRHWLAERQIPFTFIREDA